MAEPVSPINPVEQAQVAESLLHSDSILIRSMVTQAVIWFFRSLPEGSQGSNAGYEQRLTSAIVLMKERLFASDQQAQHGRHIEEGVRRATAALEEAHETLSRRRH